MHEYDFAIVGAGIAGASLAWQLAPSMRVLLLEAESQPGFHSTGRSAAMFIESYGSPQGRALTRASRAFYAAPPEGFADTPILQPRGVLYVGWQGQEDLLDEAEAALRAGGADGLERLDPPATLRRLPVLRANGLLGALSEPLAMDIDVHALHQGWLRGARRRGVTLCCDARLQSARHDGRHWHLQWTDGQAATARRLVNAAGAWADEVARCAGVAPLGLQPRRRSAFSFDAPEGVGHRDWPAAIAVDEGWYFKPDAGQLLGSPANADPAPPHDVQAEEIDIAVAIDRIEAHSMLRIRRPRRSWAGLRSFAPDGEMLVGPDPHQAAFFWLAGQGGWGIQSADGAARLAASLLTDACPPGDLRAAGVAAAALAPARFRR